MSQLIKMLMSRQRHPAAAPIVPIAPYSRSAAPGAAEAGPCLPSLCKHSAGQNRSGGRAGSAELPRAAPGAHPGRGPRGEAREGERRRLAPERCSSSRVLFHEWINNGQARWPVDEQRGGSAGCGSAGKAGSPPVGAVGSGECDRTPAMPPSLNNYPRGD